MPVIKLSESQQAKLAQGGVSLSANLEYVNEENLGMGSHGCERVVVACKHLKTGKLYGFIYERNSEEWTYDYEDAVPITEKAVLVKSYKKSDGEDWWTCL